MKKRTAILCLSAVLSVVTLFVCLDFNTCEKQKKTIPCDGTGMIFSITTFDGEGETAPFVKCLGHTWVSLENRTGHAVHFYGQNLENGEILTFSVWAISGYRGLIFNMEPHFIKDYDRYVGRQSLSVNIDESQLAVIEDYLDENHEWKLMKNCSYWAVHLWNAVVGEEFALKTQTLVYTPKRLQNAMNEFDCIEADRDFSGAKGIFFYRDGQRTELALCS